MTHFLQDILRQPEELRRVIRCLDGTDRRKIESAAETIRAARLIYLSGIGASWHAALAAGSLFSSSGLPVQAVDASEMLTFTTLPPDSVIVIISRSGRSVEIVKLLAKAREAGAQVIGITSSKDGVLAREARIPVIVPVRADYAISVNTYSALAATAGAIASAALGTFEGDLVAALLQALTAAEDSISRWQQQLADTSWLRPGATHYFLARGSSLASCFGARLLWEEGVKSPATCMGTGNFRHGPQEIVRKGMRFGIWLDSEQMREQDLSVARDLTAWGASVMLVGHGLPEDAGELVFQIPEPMRQWQFLVDIIPAQLAAERLASLSGVDCDSFRYAAFIVEDDYGLSRRDRAGSADR